MNTIDWILYKYSQNLLQKATFYAIIQGDFERTPERMIL